MGCLLDSDWSRKILLRCDWLVPLVALYTTQALKILFSRLQSSTDLFRSGKTKQKRIKSEQHDTSFLHTKYYSF